MKEYKRKNLGQESVQSILQKGANQECTAVKAESSDSEIERCHSERRNMAMGLV